MWASTAQPTLLSELCLALLSGMSTTLMGHRPGWHGLIYRITTIQYREKYRTVLIVEGDKYDFLSFIKGSPPPSPPQLLLWPESPPPSTTPTAHPPKSTPPPATITWRRDSAPHHCIVSPSPLPRSTTTAAMLLRHCVIGPALTLGQAARNRSHGREAQYEARSNIVSVL
jgi:hypothetical protein